MAEHPARAANEIDEGAAGTQSAAHPPQPGWLDGWAAAGLRGQRLRARMTREMALPATQRNGMPTASREITLGSKRAVVPDLT